MGILTAHKAKWRRFELCLTVLLALNLSARQAACQHISNEVLPTEEELLWALSVGAINGNEFELALERFFWFDEFRTDSSVNDIPNLDLTAGQTSGELDALQREQLSGFLNSGGGDRSSYPISGRIRIYSDQELNGAERTRQVYQVRISGGRRWELSGALGSRHGSDVIVRSRTLRLTPFQEKNLSLTVGSFHVKRGASLAIGRRSKILLPATELGYESWLTPARGGFNGLALEHTHRLSQANSLNWLLALSSQRDEFTRHNTVALSAEIKSRYVTVGATHTFSRLERRDTQNKFEQRQYSWYTSVRKKAFRGLAEVNLQSNQGRQELAGVAEARYQTGDGNVRAAFWVYPAGYVNLLGSGKSSILYETVRLSDDAFGFRDRRVDQRGGLIRSLSPLGGGIDLETGLDLSGQSDGDLQSDYIVALHKNIEGVGRIKVECGGRFNDFGGRITRNRWRIRTQLTSKRSWGSFRLAAQFERSGPRSENLALFGRITANLGRRRLELWSNISKYSIRLKGVSRSYSYVRFSSPIDASGAIRIASKVTYRYVGGGQQNSIVTARVEIISNW